MKLSVFLMPLHRPVRLHAETYDQDLEPMTLADRLGSTAAAYCWRYARRL